jgi:ACS family hexuronate transporter-like MFS transporter
VCGLLLLATMINYMDRLTLNLMAKRIKDDLVLSNEMYGEVEEKFGYAFAAGALLFGFIVDRWNARWVYAFALFAWSAAGFVTGFATTFAGLLWCRFLLGLFEAGNWPCALRTTQRILPPEKRTMGNSLLQSGAAFGAILVPIIVGFFVTGAGGPWVSQYVAWSHSPLRPEYVELLGVAPGAHFPGTLSWKALFASGYMGTWRYPFFVIGAVGLVWVVLWLVSVRRPDLALAHRAGGPASPADDRPLAEIFLSRRFAVLVVMVICINLTWHFLRVWLALFLQEQHSFTETQLERFMTAYYVATDVGSLAAGFGTLWLARRGLSVHASRSLVFLTCAQLVLVVLVVAALPPGHGLLLQGLLMVAGFGALGVYPVYYSLSQDLTTRHQGKVTGALGCITWLASAKMQPLIGRWLDRTEKDYATVITVIGVLPLVAFLWMYFVWYQADGPAASPAPEDAAESETLASQ